MNNGLLAALVVIGHVGAFVFLINVLHAQGLTPRLLSWTNRGAALAALLGAAALAWELALGSSNPWWWPVRGYAWVCLAVGLVAIPGSSLLLRLRRLPAGIQERGEEIDLAERYGREALIGDGRYRALLKVRRNEAFRLRKRDWTIEIPSLPPEWDGLNIVQVSDLHFAPCFQQRFFEHVADEAAHWPADLVVFTGDLVDHDQAIDWIVPVLSRLKGRLGTFSILGNHDFSHHPERVREELERAGYTDLEGRWIQLEIEGGTLALGGTSAPWGPKLDFRSIPEADFRCLLSHSPDLFPRAVGAGIDLMLSGHNHGGQIRLPGVGPVFMPSRYSRRFDRGYFRSGRTLLHVSQGVAGKHPIRIGCVPEISRLVLRVQVESDRQPSRAFDSALSRQDDTPSFAS